MSLREKVALVTGASRGIGAATAHKLAARGAAVAVAYKENQSGAEKVVSAIRASGGTAAAFQVAIEDDASVQQLLADVVKAFGRIDILVNNAGVAGTRSLIVSQGVV